jgi:hypothetical protein
MKLLSEEHDEKYLKGGVTGFFIGTAIATVGTVLFVNHQLILTTALGVVVLACLITAGVVIDGVAHQHDTIKEVDRWR